MNDEIADRLLNRGAKQLNGKSFKEAFTDSLNQLRDRLTEHPPELLFLTGGVSRLPAIRQWCAEAFPEAVVITGAEPEFSVSRGLAWSGRIDDELREFRREVAELVDSSAVEQIVDDRIDDLYRRVVDALVEPILRQVAMPVFDRWRDGDIQRLSDIDQIVQKEIEAWLHTDEAQALMVKPIAEWLKPVAYDVEEKTMPICVRHNVPYRAMSLNSYFSLSDVDIRIDAREVFAVEGFTWHHLHHRGADLRRQRHRRRLQRHFRHTGRGDTVAADPAPGQGEDAAGVHERRHPQAHAQAGAPQPLRGADRAHDRGGQVRLLQEPGEREERRDHCPPVRRDLPADRAVPDEDG